MALGQVAEVNWQNVSLQIRSAPLTGNIFMDYITRTNLRLDQMF